MEPTVDSLFQSLPPNLQQTGKAGREWVLSELLNLLAKYPGGITAAIAQTHLYSKLQQDGRKNDGRGVRTRQSLDSSCALDHCKLSSLAARKGSVGGCACVEVSGVRLHRVGVLSDTSNCETAQSATEGATLELSDGSLQGLCCMRLHQRFWHLVQGKQGHLSVGVRLRLANLKPYKCSTTSTAANVAPLRLLPTEELVIVATEQQLSQHSEAICDVESLRRIECNATGGRVILRGRLLCRVKAVGPVSRGCRCALCDASRGGQHRIITVSQHHSGEQPPTLPFILYDKQVALGDILREGELLALDAVVVRRLSAAAAQCVAGADTQSQLCSPPQPGDFVPLCIEVGVDTTLRVAETTSAAPGQSVAVQGGAKRMKLDGCDGLGRGVAEPGPRRVLVGELLSLRYTKGVISTQLGSTQCGSTQTGNSQAMREQPPSLHMSLRADGIKAEVEVKHQKGRRELLRVVRSLQPGHIVVASGIKPSGPQSVCGQCRTYVLEVGGESGQLTNLSTLPGLLASSQLTREYVRSLGEATLGMGAPQGKLSQPTIKLARVTLGELQVRVRRAHQHCLRPLVGSSLLEGFFDDEDCDTAGGADSEHTDMPVSPNRVGPDFRDGLWECRFCDRECGSSEVEAQLVGFLSVRDVSADGAEAWFAIHGAVVETLISMPATQYLSLSSEGKADVLQGVRGKRAMLSLCHVAESDSKRLSFDGWTLCPEGGRSGEPNRSVLTCATVHIAGALLC